MTDPICPACGVPYSDHLGLNGTCAELQRLRADYSKLVAGIDAVCNLMEATQGVDGLHDNGDFARWPSLLRGGKFEEWLLEFSEAVDLTSKKNGGAT